jgi:hypothetical protein
MNRDTLRQILVLLAVLVTIAVNALANVLPLNGLNTGEISDRFQVYFTPAGYVFSIWGLIYLGLIAYAVFQALPGQRANPGLRRIGLPFLVASAANFAWLFFWHYELFTLTLPAMLILLACLIAIYLRLDIGRGPVAPAERWLVHAPFSLYLGWITVATIANVTSLLDYLQWGGWGITEAIWLVIVLAVAIAIAAWMAWSRRDVVYLLVLVWAFAGIGVKHSGAAVVASAAWSATVLAAGLALASLFIRRRSPAAA